MQKDFDRWNERKKTIHFEIQNRLYHERDIWWCSLGLNVGFEQDGAGPVGDRPVLIVRGFSRQVCLVVPLTTSRKKNLYHFSLGNLNGRESFAIISQLRLIDTKRLINQIGFLDSKKFVEIRKSIRDLF